MKLKFVAIAAATTAALLLGATASAAPDQSKKQYVCHFTGSESNPVVIINVGNAAVPHHVTNHTPDVHQGTDSDSNTPPTNCTGGE